MSETIHRLMSGFPPAAADQVKASNWRTPRRVRWSFNHVRELLPTATIAPAANPTTLTVTTQDLSNLTFFDQHNKRLNLQNFLTTSHTDAFAVLHRGKLVFDWFDGFGARDRPHIIFSITKSMAALLAGILVGRGLLDPQELVTEYLPELAESAYKGARLKHLLDMQIASGFSENYSDTQGIFMAYRRAAAWNPVEEGVETEGLRNFLTRMPSSTTATHGGLYHYCSPHSDVLGWLIERVGNDSFANQFSKNILEPCGGRDAGYLILDTYGAPRVSGGMCLCLHDLLLIGEMVRNHGKIQGVQVVPSSWIEDFTKVSDNSAWRAQREANGHRLFDQGNYRSLWYQTGFADREICGIGIHGQWLWINPKKEIVIVKLASHDNELDTATDGVMLAAFAAIAEALA